VPSSGLQAEFVERKPGKMRAPSQAPNKALQLFVPFDPAQGRPVPSLLRARPSIATVS